MNNMTNKIKILIFSSLILLALILYLILTSDSVRPTDQATPQAEQAAVLSEGDYQLKVKEVFKAYEELSRDNNLTVEKIAELKNELFNFKGLPAKFKNLHINFVLAMDRMEDYLKVNDQQARNASQQIISQLKADYSWLND